MNLLEYQGKKLLRAYGIPVPAFQLFTSGASRLRLPLPIVLKSQVPVGDRARRGGIVSVHRLSGFKQALVALWQRPIDGHIPQRIIAETHIKALAERYISISYDTAQRCPVLALSARGGTGVHSASITLLDPWLGIPSFLAREAVLTAKLTPHAELIKVVQALWRLFATERALLAEINPLFELSDGRCIAGDAKIILDDQVVQPHVRPLLELKGDIAVLASGGGASMLNLDALLRAGGTPANYVEYSGNPKAGIVQALTKKVLSRPGLAGCWVVGGTANFTDIYETMQGFVAGLRLVKPKPRYPIVIRRDGPRQAEAFRFLRSVASSEGYDFHLFGPDTPMSDSAAVLIRLAKRFRKQKRL